MSSSKNELLLIDVTGLSSVARTTGIQKVLRDVLADASEFKLLVFDERINQFVELLEAPQLRPRFSSSSLESLRSRLVSLLSGAAPGLFQLVSNRLGPSASAWLRKIATVLYHFSLSEQKFTNEGKKRHPVDQASLAGRLVWLFDIPRSKEHLRFLRHRVEAGHMKLGVYLYDIIPFTHPELVANGNEDLVKREFQEFLELVQLADTVVFLSKFTQSHYFEYLHSQNASLPKYHAVVYPPVRLSTKRIKSTLESRKVRNSDSDYMLRILAITPLTRRKNAAVLIRAVGILLREGVPVRLTLLSPPLAGNDPETVRLLREAVRKFPKNYVLLESVSEEKLEELYEDCDVVAVPSLIEGFGLPLLEAANAHKPLVCSDSEIFRELSAFINLKLVEPHNPERWAKVLHKSATLETFGFKRDFLPSRSEFLHQLRLLETSALASRTTSPKRNGA